MIYALYIQIFIEIFQFLAELCARGTIIEQMEYRAIYKTFRFYRISLHKFDELLTFCFS